MLEMTCHTALPRLVEQSFLGHLCFKHTDVSALNVSHILAQRGNFSRLRETLYCIGTSCAGIPQKENKFPTDKISNDIQHLAKKNMFVAQRFLGHNCLRLHRCVRGQRACLLAQHVLSIGWTKQLYWLGKLCIFANKLWYLYAMLEMTCHTALPRLVEQSFLGHPCFKHTDVSALNVSRILAQRGNFSRLRETLYCIGTSCAGIPQKDNKFPTDKISNDMQHLAKKNMFVAQRFLGHNCLRLHRCVRGQRACLLAQHVLSIGWTKQLYWLGKLCIFANKLWYLYAMLEMTCHTALPRLVEQSFLGHLCFKHTDVSALNVSHILAQRGNFSRLRETLYCIGTSCAGIPQKDNKFPTDKISNDIQHLAKKNMFVAQRFLGHNCLRLHRCVRGQRACLLAQHVLSIGWTKQLYWLGKLCIFANKLWYLYAMLEMTCHTALPRLVEQSFLGHLCFKHTDVSALNVSHILAQRGNFSRLRETLYCIGTSCAGIPPKNNTFPTDKIWVFPKIGVGPQNGWFTMENPMNKWMIWGVFPLFLVRHPNF